MTRHGKIARLPREIRDQLNVRLNNGEVGKQLVEWLNGLPEAQAIIAAQFGGKPVNEQNLSEWKRGGFEDWLRHQDDCAQARSLTENARDLENEAGEIRLEDCLAAPMAVALARLLRELDELPNGMDKQKALLCVARELAQLRRSSHEAERVRLKRERWEAEQTEVSEEKRRGAEFSEIWQRSLKTHFPEFSLDTHLSSSGMSSAELRACLEANDRLRRAQGGAGESKEKEIAENGSK